MDSSYEVKFWNEDFRERKYASVDISEAEINHLLHLLEKNADTDMEIYKILCKSLRSFY